MNTKFLTKVRYTKEFTDGTIKRVSEQYCLDAETFGNAEERIYNEVGEYVRGEFLVQAIAKIDLSDIFYFDDAQTWYLCSIQFTYQDSDSGKEKKQKNVYLLTAHSTKEANTRLIDCVEGLLGHYEITEVKKTKIVDYFPYLPGDDKTEEE